MTPAVSIITPTFNRHALLQAQHVHLLAQSEQDFEWLILDDGPQPSAYFRGLSDPRILATSSLSDVAILLILFVQLLLGLSTIVVSLNHLDGHEMVKFMTWAQGVLTLQSDNWQVVADVTPRRRSQPGNDGCVTPLG